ncbi:MAG: hypothetical protein ABIK80_03965 [candidate division WOR-3 bacterium]
MRVKIIFLFLIFLTFLFSQEDTLKEEKPIKERNYRSYFIASEVVLGIGIYSWTLPLGLGLKDRLAVALGLWTPAISFFASSRVRKVKASGTPLQSFFGGISGVWRGAWLNPVWNPNNKINEYTLPLIFSLTENIGGYFLSEKLKFGVEDAWRYLNFNILGISHSVFIQLLTIKYYDERDLPKFKYWFHLYAFLPALEGYCGSIILSKEKNITFGDAFCELEYARLGITSPIAFLGGMELLTNKDFFNKNSVALSSLLGSCLGYYFGYKMSKERDLSLGKALLVSFAPRMIEGIILGTVVLIASENWDRTKWGITLITLSIADPIGTYLIDKKLNE